MTISGGAHPVFAKCAGAGSESALWLDLRGAMSVGWNFPLAGHVTTGPVVAWRYDGTTPMMINEFGDSVTTRR